MAKKAKANGKRRLIEYRVHALLRIDPTIGSGTDALADLESAIESAGAKIVVPVSWRVVRVPAETEG